MEKTATLNLRVNPAVKERAEAVLSRLGVPMSTAIDMYLNQISLTGGIPFAVTLPKVPDMINTDLMSNEEIHTKLTKGYDCLLYTSPSPRDANASRMPSSA